MEPLNGILSEDTFSGFLNHNLVDIIIEYVTNVNYDKCLTELVNRVEEWNEWNKRNGKMFVDGELLIKIRIRHFSLERYSRSNKRYKSLWKYYGFLYHNN